MKTNPPTSDLLDEAGRVKAGEDNRSGQLTVFVLQAAGVEEDQIEHLNHRTCVQET